MALDSDIKKMSHGERGKEIARVRKLIRTHKRKEGNARCWLNDCNLYRAVLPEGGEGAGRMSLPTCVLLGFCKKYIEGQKRKIVKPTQGKGVKKKWKTKK